MLGLRTRARRATEWLTLSSAVSPTRRREMLRQQGWTGIGDCWIEAGCEFDIPRAARASVVIERGAYVNRGVLIAAPAGLLVGQDAAIGYRCTLVGVSHDYTDPGRRAGEHVTGPIVIGRGAWLGANVTVLPGVTIGEGTVVAAGAVVTRDCEPHCLYAGVPAKLVRRLGR